MPSRESKEAQKFERTQRRLREAVEAGISTMGLLEESLLVPYLSLNRKHRKHAQECRAAAEEVARHYARLGWHTFVFPGQAGSDTEPYLWLGRVPLLRTDPAYLERLPHRNKILRLVWRIIDAHPMESHTLHVRLERHLFREDAALDVAEYYRRKDWKVEVYDLEDDPSGDFFIDLTPP